MYHLHIYVSVCTVCIHLFVTHHLVFAEYWCYLSYSYIVCSLTIWGTVSFSSFSIRKHHSLLIQQFYISNLYFNPKNLKLCFSCVFHFFATFSFTGGRWHLIDLHIFVMIFSGVCIQIIEELSSLKRIRGPDPNYNDICFSGAGRLYLYSISLLSFCLLGTPCNA